VRPSIVGLPPGEPGPDFGTGIGELVQRAWGAVKEARLARAEAAAAARDAAFEALIRRLGERHLGSWDDAPLMPGVLVGARAWQVTDDGELLSPYRDDRWPAFERQVARCFPRLHADGAPAAGCTCGIYALNEVGVHLRAAFAGTYVVGTVSLWGRVVRAASGYRAQYAYPRLLVVPGSASLAQAVAERYGVPVLALRTASRAWRGATEFLERDMGALSGSRPRCSRVAA
jgi:hypothetical protein